MIKFHCSCIHAVVRILYIARITNAIQLRNLSSNTGQTNATGSDVIATLNFSPSSSSTSSNNLLAYRPRYNDFHTSGLAVVFVNIDGIFPCLTGPPGYAPICKLFTHEEDGFRNGRALIDASDGGNDFRVFGGTTTATYGFAFANCPEMTTSCFPLSTEHSIVCLLPRNRCG